MRVLVRVRNGGNASGKRMVLTVDRADAGGRVDGEVEMNKKRSNGRVRAEKDGIDRNRALSGSRALLSPAPVWRMPACAPCWRYEGS